MEKKEIYGFDALALFMHPSTNIPFKFQHINIINESENMYEAQSITQYPHIYLYQVYHHIIFSIHLTVIHQSKTFKYIVKNVSTSLTNKLA